MLPAINKGKSIIIKFLRAIATKEKNELVRGKISLCPRSSNYVYNSFAVTSYATINNGNKSLN
jgi:hypothetical protein